MYSGGSALSVDIHFVCFNLSFPALSPLPIVLSRHFNHPHPYIDIAVAISDITHSGGMQECVIPSMSITSNPLWLLSLMQSGDTTQQPTTGRRPSMTRRCMEPHLK